MRFSVLSLKDIYSTACTPETKNLYDIILKGIDSFECSVSKYHENFLKTCIEQYDKHDSSRTYVLVSTDELTEKPSESIDFSRIIAGFFTIGITSLSLNEPKISITKKQRKKIRSHTFVKNETLGCFVIGELCRASNRSSEELPGQDILNECMSQIKFAQSIIGGRLVLVDSRRKVLESLYKPFGFIELMPTGKQTYDGENLITSFAILDND